MQALVWDGRAARIVERDPPPLSEDAALVRVKLAGICDTDLQILAGYLGFRGVLGHEFVGCVVEGPDPWPGMRVVSEINFACGRCPVCLGGMGRHCPARRVMGISNADGAFAELVVVPAANLHEVPDNVANEAAVFAEPLAAAFEILEQVNLVPDSEVTVLGDGKLGLLAAQVLQQAGASVLAVGKHDENLSILRRRGIGTTLLASWDRTPADVVVEATGTAAGFELAVSATRPRGTVVLKTTVAKTAPLDLAPVVINELSVIGSRCGPFEPALRALASRSIDVRPLVAARLPLAEGPRGLRLAAEPGVLKVLLENTSGG